MPCFRHEVSTLSCVWEEFSASFGFYEKSKMAASVVDSDAVDVADCLNALSSVGMRSIASEDVLADLVNDYFVRRPISNEDDDRESSDDEDVDSVVDIESVVDNGAGDNTDSSDDDAATADRPGMVLADEIMPRDRGDAPEKKFTPKCKCKLHNGQPCHTRYAPGELADIRLQYLTMTHDELDIAVLAKLSCGMHLSSMTTKTRRGQQQERQAQRTDFYLHGFRICRDLFKQIHTISQDKLTALIAHYKVAGCEARVHRSKHKRPANALKFEDTRAVIDFIVNYAEANAIILPGRTPGHWKTDVKLLPTNCSKKKVYQHYCDASDAAGTRKVAVQTFRRLWQQLLPFVVTMRPATDLCWYCQKGVTKLTRSANLPDAEKTAAVREYEEHLHRATTERAHYTDVCKSVKESMPPGLSLGPHAACSFAGKCHYGFDFAQQVHFPSNPLQPGPIYFKCPRKCGLFGVACEAFPKQVNFMLDESVNTGKGANCVVSLLHFFFEKYGLGEHDVHLHADNCCGQNKNTCMMQYLMWRVLTGRHKKITLSFLLTGHTKFSCDWCFGLVKRLYRKTKVDCLDDIAAVVTESSTVNIPQLCGTENGEVIVPTFDWTSFLGIYFRKVSTIKRFHHFHFVEGSTTMRVQEFVDSTFAEQPLLRQSLPHKEAMPQVIKPKGLDAKRQWYLYNEIRPFTAERCQEITTPLPTAAKPKRKIEAVSSDSDDTNDPPPPPRRRPARERRAARSEQ